VLLEQGPALALGHAAPNSELHPVIQGIGSALGDHRAVPADDRGLALGSPTNEQLVRIGRTTQSLGYPRDPGFPVRYLE